MSKKFDEWYNHFYGGVLDEYDENHKVESEKAWDACKQEIIKEIKNYPDYILDDLIAKIEKEF